MKRVYNVRSIKYIRTSAFSNSFLLCAQSSDNVARAAPRGVTANMHAKLSREGKKSLRDYSLRVLIRFTSHNIYTTYTRVHSRKINSKRRCGCKKRIHLHTQNREMQYIYTYIQNSREEIGLLADGIAASGHEPRSRRRRLCLDNISQT